MSRHAGASQGLIDHEEEADEVTEDNIENEQVPVPEEIFIPPAEQNFGLIDHDEVIPAAEENTENTETYEIGGNDYEVNTIPMDIEGVTMTLNEDIEAVAINVDNEDTENAENDNLNDSAELSEVVSNFDEDQVETVASPEIENPIRAMPCNVQYIASEDIYLVTKGRGNPIWVDLKKHFCSQDKKCSIKKP